MVCPNIALRMEQYSFFLSGWIGGCCAIPLKSIAGRTGQAEVFENCSAALRTREDMFEFKNSDSLVFSRAAIRTAIRKTIAKLALKIDGNVNTHVRVAAAF